jgi:multimeric flavodoxin WrbA
MNFSEQIENPDLENLRYLAKELLEKSENNGWGVMSYDLKDVMLCEIIKCFYGKEYLEKLRYDQPSEIQRNIVNE